MLGKIFQGVAFILLLNGIVSCKKNDSEVLPDTYTFTKFHNDWSIDNSGQSTSTTTHSSPFTMLLPTIEKNAEIIFQGDNLSPFKYEHSDTSFWLFTPDGEYTYSPYNGSSLEYFPLNDSIHYAKWYDGSHTYGHSDNYYGKKK